MSGYPSLFAQEATPGRTIEGATVGPRALARLIDRGLVYGAVAVGSAGAGVLIILVCALFGRDGAALVRHATEGGALTVVAVAVAEVMYHALCETVVGATPGKRLVGLVVVSEELQPISLRAGFGRSLAMFIDALFFGLVGIAKMKESELRQRHGDVWNRTVVLKRSAAPMEMLHGTSRMIVASLWALYAVAKIILLVIVAAALMA